MDYEKQLLNEMAKSIQRIDESTDHINITLAIQATQLAEHIKRSDNLEEAMKPLQAHVNRVNALLLILGGIFALLGALKGVVEIAQLLHLF